MDLQKKLISKMMENDPESAPEQIKLPRNPICPKCNKEVKADAKFCTGCGGKIEPFSPIAPKTAEPKTEFDAPTAQRPIRFRLRQSESTPLNPSEIFSAGNVLTALGLILFAAASRLPYGILPPPKTMMGVGVPWSRSFPFLFYIPYFAILIFIALSMKGFALPQNLYNKYFKRGLIAAGFIFILLLYSMFFSKINFIALIFFYCVFLLILKKSNGFLSNFQQFAGAAFVSDAYLIMVSLFLKTELLSNTGSGFSANRGYYVHMVAALAVLAGCLIKRSPSFAQTDAAPPMEQPEP
ncbi:MAG: zinc ribbon domain-containing protein [bacterium]